MQPPDEERRNFCVACIYALWGAITAALGVPAAAYLLAPPRARQESDWVEAGEVARLPVGVPEEVVFRRIRRDGWRVVSEKASAWVIRRHDGSLTAFAPQCTHLGCAYQWDEHKQNFLCPCHASTFDLEGNVLSGPAPRALDRYAVRLEGGKLLLGPVRSSRSGAA